MRLPLELSNCTVDMEEVASVKYCSTDRRTSLCTRAQFKATVLQNQRLIVALRSGHVLDLRGEDAAVFNSVFSKQVKGRLQLAQANVIAWRKQIEENKDTPKESEGTPDD